MDDNIKMQTGNEEWLKTVKRADPVEVLRFCPGRPYVELKMPDTLIKVERVTIVTVSHDEGFSGTQATLGGAYEQSYTWFEAVTVSPSNHERAPSIDVQKNVNASLEFRRHENEWDASNSDTTIRSWLSTIRGGDTLQIIPKADWKAWVNYVKEVEVTVVGRVHSPDHAFPPVPADDIAIYQKLAEGRREIRVLALDPGAFEDPISCSITTISLEDEHHLRYEALSCCWGEMKYMEAIMLRQSSTSRPSAGQNAEDRHTIMNTPLLTKALRYLRPVSGPPRILWIDALCSYSHRTATKHLGTLRFVP